MIKQHIALLARSIFSACILTYPSMNLSVASEKEFDSSAEFEKLQAIFSKQSQTQKGEFTQHRFLSVLDAPLMSSGAFEFIENQTLTWHVLSPFEIQYLYDGEILKQIELDQTITVTQKDDPMLIGFFSFFFELLHGDIKALSRFFTIEQFEPDETSPYRIVLTPNKRFLEKSFKDIEIHVFRNQMQKIFINENNEDKIALEFQFPQE